MSILKFAGLGTLSAAAAVIVMGCGGSGSGSAAASSSSSVAAASNSSASSAVAGETINAEAVASAVTWLTTHGICLAAGAQASSQSSASSSASVDGNDGLDITVLSSSSLSSISSSGSNSSFNPFPAGARAPSVNTFSIDGDLSGVLDVRYTFESGITTYDLDFKQFENLINGKAVAMDGMQMIEYDFASSLPSAASHTDGAIDVAYGDLNVAKRYQCSYEVDDYSESNAGAYDGSLHDVRIDTITMTDTEDDKQYTLKNVEIETVVTLENWSFASLSAEFDGTEAGALVVTNESQTIEMDITQFAAGGISLPTNIDGSFGFEAADGSKAIVSVAGSSVRIFTRGAGGDNVLAAELECPALIAQ